MLSRKTSTALLIVTLLSGCKALPEYDGSRSVSAVDFGEELLLAAAQPNKKQNYSINNQGVRNLSGRNLIALDYPIVIGQRLASYCTKSGGKLLQPTLMPAEVRAPKSLSPQTEWERVTYGCKRANNTDFIFSVLDIRPTPKVLSYFYDIEVIEEIPDHHQDFLDRIHHFGFELAKE